MKNITSVLVSTLLLFSCKNKEVKKTQELSLTDSTISAKSDSMEIFINFFLQFKKDSVFQINRIKFPLEENYLDLDKEDGTIIRKLIRRRDWKYESFYWDSSYTKKRFGAFNQWIEQLGDWAIVFWEGVENGIDLEFIFKLQHDKWYLCKISDSSN